MPEGLLILLLQIGFFATMLLGGLGVAAWLAPRPDWPSWAPLVGTSLLGALFVAGGVVVPGQQLVFVVLVPVLVCSVGLAAAAIARRRVSAWDPASAIYPMLATLPPLLVAVLPFARNETSGPVSVFSTESWFFYIPLADYLRENTITSTLSPDFAPASHRIADLLPVGLRVGFEETLVAFTSTFGVDVRTGLAPLVGAILMLLGVTVYVLAREALGLKPPIAALAGAAASTGSMVLIPAFESSGPSLFAYSAFPAALWLATRTIRGEWRSALMAGLVGAGILAFYPELLPALLLGVAFLLVAAVLTAVRRRELRGLLRPAALLAMAGGVALVVSPPATVRSVRYLRWLRENNDLTAVPDWGINYENVLPLLLGFSNFLEARRQPQMDTLQVAGLFLLVALMLAAAIIFFAMSRSRATRSASEMDLADSVAGSPLVGSRTWLASALTASLAVMIWAQEGESCNYCFYRSSAFLGPLFVLAAAGGLATLWARGRGHKLIRVATASVAVVLLAAGARATFTSVEAASGSRTLTDGSADRLSTYVESQENASPVLIEGADAGYHITPFFFVSQAMHFVAQGGARPVVDRGLNSWVYGGGYEPLGERAFDPDYELVATRFGGVANDRRTVGIAEPLVVQERAPKDVSIQTRAVWSVPVGTPAAQAVPWISGPFHVLVSDPKVEPVAVLLRFEGPRAGEVNVSASSVGRPLPTRQTSGLDDTVVCISLQNATPFAQVDIDPGLAVPLPGLVLPDEPAPELPQEISVTEARVVAQGDSRCAPPQVPLSANDALASAE